jgi:hypothetical protein
VGRRRYSDVPYKTSNNRKKGTVVLVKAGEREYKYPIGDKGEARNAMARLNQAKPPLPTAIKKHVARVAKSVLGKETEAIKRIFGL